MLKRSVVALMVLLGVGCGRAPAEETRAKYFAAANGPVEFAFPRGWRENTAKHPYDLQCVAKDESMNTGVFLFLPEDLAETTVPRQLLDRQIEDLKSKRENFKVVKDEQVVEIEGKRLTTLVFTGEKDSSRNYYRFTLIEFTANPRLIPVVLQVCRPSGWEQNEPVLAAITASARVLVPDSGAGK